MSAEVQHGRSARVGPGTNLTLAPQLDPTLTPTPAPYLGQRAPFDDHFVREHWAQDGAAAGAKSAVSKVVG